MNVLDTEKSASTSPSSGGSAEQRRRRGRAARFLRRGGVAVVAVLALIGAVSTWNWFTAAPDSGHFRSLEGRDEYVAAYEESFAALPPPTATHDLRTSHGIVRVYEWSSPATEAEEPIVLMPGRSSGAPMWSQNLPALVAEHPVFAFDALGDAGMSVQQVRFDGYEDQATYLADLVEQVAPEGAHLVGHSFGGRLAVSLASARPELVTSLSLLEPAMAFANPPVDILLWSGVAFLPGIPESWRSRALTEIGGEPYDPEDPMARMIEAGAEHYQAGLPQPGVLSEEEIAGLEMPVYVALGERGSLAGGDRAAEAAGGLPDGTVQVWPGTTHSLPMQAGAELDRVVLAHIAAS